MQTIHPTALISEEVTLAEHVTIGPYCILDGCITIQNGTILKANVHLFGNVSVGQQNTIHSNAVIGDMPQDLSFPPETTSGVIIGDQNTIRENVTIHRASKENGNTTIGDHNFLMAGAHLAHDTSVANHTIIANNCLLAGFVEVGSHVFLGGGSVFHQFMRIGDYAMTQGNSGLGQDLPPYCVGHSVNKLSGLNLVGMKRAGFSPTERKEIKNLYALLFQSKSSLADAILSIEQQSWSEAALRLLSAVKYPTKRGILTR